MPSVFLVIDWGFISSPAIEGCNLLGVVPDATGSQSGVTVAAGIDLGQKGPMDLAGLPDDLAALLTPFLGLRGALAVAALAKRPLHITKAQAFLLTAREGARVTVACRAHFPGFDGLPDACQTVLVSLVWQYGSPWVRAHHTWGHALEGEWKQVIADLRDFGDRYPGRHAAEAAYLEAALSPGHSPAH